MGKKYIIELEDNESVYKTVYNTIIADEHPILQVIAPAPYTEPDTEKVREEAYYKGYETAKHECEQCLKVRADAEQELAEKAYQHGLNDAWEAARKICLEDDDGGIPASAINDIFSVRNYRNALRDFSVSEAVKKIRAYEQEQEEIQVGDEIVRSNGEKYVVLIVNDERKLVTILRHDGYKRTIESKWVTKTGRHFPEIAEVLKKMKE